MKKTLTTTNDSFGLGAILSSIFVTLVLLSNIVSVKIVAFMGWAFDAGTIMYPITFALKDMIQKRFGRKAARKVIWTTYGLMAFAFFMFWLVSIIPADPSWHNSEAFNLILAPMGRIVLASITAGIISELLDTKVFSLLWKKFNQLWVSFISNAIGLTIDTLIFVTIAFFGTVPMDVLIQIAVVNFVGKFLISIIALPSILTVKPTAKELI